MMLSKRLSSGVLGIPAILCGNLCGCSSSDDSSSDQPLEVGHDFDIAFDPMYSAYDGVHDFKVPVKAPEGLNVAWQASEDGYVDIEATGPNTAMLLMRQPGTVDIIARIGDLSTKATLTISEASSDAWELGNARYNNGIPSFDPSNIDLSMFRIDPSNPPMIQDFISAESACTNCHSSTGADAPEGGFALPLDIEHTPQQIGGYSDQELVNIFTRGEKPEGVGLRNATGFLTPEFWSQGHQWQMTEQEAQGIVVYLRALQPKEQGEAFDFGAIMRPPGFGGGGVTPPPPEGDMPSGENPPMDPPPDPQM